jgi:hypothetical protein
MSQRGASTLMCVSGLPSSPMVQQAEGHTAVDEEQQEEKRAGSRQPHAARTARGRDSGGHAGHDTAPSWAIARPATDRSSRPISRQAASRGPTASGCSAAARQPDLAGKSSRRAVRTHDVRPISRPKGGGAEWESRLAHSALSSAIECPRDLVPTRLKKAARAFPAVLLANDAPHNRAERAFGRVALHGGSGGQLHDPP